jgi:hypothetical protein
MLVIITAMPTLATRFSLILAGLRAAIAPVAARDRARTALLVLLWGRLARSATRFERLFARWREGTLPKPRPSRAGQPTTRQPHPHLPANPAWLVAMARETAPMASQLQHLLAHPDITEFLAAAPQAGRILRPLCHMLGIPRPPALPPPPRKRPPTQPTVGWAQPTTAPTPAVSPPPRAMPPALALRASPA